MTLSLQLQANIFMDLWNFFYSEIREAGKNEAVPFL